MTYVFTLFSQLIVNLSSQMRTRPLGFVVPEGNTYPIFRRCKSIEEESQNKVAR